MVMGDWVSAALTQLERAQRPGDETAQLRAAVYRDGRISADEARKFLSMHAAGVGAGAGAAWSDLLIETLVDHFALSRAEPDPAKLHAKPVWANAVRMALDTLSGGAAADVQRPLWADAQIPQVSEADARVLVDALAADGMALDQTEVRLLARLFAVAVDYPANLRRFALEALSATVAADKDITAADAELVRAIVLGPASEAGLGVSVAEAETLWRIDHQAPDGAKDPAWTAVFSRAIALFLLHAGQTPGAVDEAEACWLLKRIGAELSASERALIDTLEELADQIDPRLLARRAPMMV
jgi:hypothetical protein